MNQEASPTTELLARIRRRRAQLIAFLRELDGAGVLPGQLPEGAVESLAEADAALARTESALARNEATAAEAARWSEQLESVEAHIRELQQEIWKAAVAGRGQG